MRFTSIAAGAAALVATSLTMPVTANAFGWTHYTDKSQPDPYAYQYEHRGYYPYYASDYWRPRHEVRRNRHRFKHPRYYSAWGLYKRDWPKYHDGHDHLKHHW